MAQYQLPGGLFLNETLSRQYQIPGGQFVNETVAGSSGSLPFGFYFAMFGA